MLVQYLLNEYIKERVNDLKPLMPAKKTNYKRSYAWATNCVLGEGLRRGWGVDKE